MRYIITTVGISLLSNYQREEVRNSIGRDYQPIDIPMKRILETVPSPRAVDIHADAYKHYVKSIREEIVPSC